MSCYIAIVGMIGRTKEERERLSVEQCMFTILLVAQTNVSASDDWAAQAVKWIMDEICTYVSFPFVLV